MIELQILKFHNFIFFHIINEYFHNIKYSLIKFILNSKINHCYNLN